MGKSKMDRFIENGMEKQKNKTIAKLDNVMCIPAIFTFCNTMCIHWLYSNLPKKQVDKTPYKWDGKNWVKVTNKGVL